MRKLTTLISSLAAAAALFALPANASAMHPCMVDQPCEGHTYPSEVGVEPHYKGWGRVNPNYCPPATACAAMFIFSAEAWRWNGSWVRTSRSTDTRVYIWPYGSGWSWTWTADKGWLAMRTHVLVRSSYGF